MAISALFDTGYLPLADAASGPTGAARGDTSRDGGGGRRDRRDQPPRNHDEEEAPPPAASSLFRVLRLDRLV